MRVSERLGSRVFIQEHFFHRIQQLPRGNFSSQVFIHKQNFGHGNLKCSRHRPLDSRPKQRFSFTSCWCCWKHRAGAPDSGPWFFGAIADGFAEMSGCVWSCSGRVQNRDVREEILGFEVLFFLAAMVSDRFAEMRGVTWRAVLAEFKTGMCEKKSWGLRFCFVLQHWFRTDLRKCPV